MRPSTPLSVSNHVGPSSPPQTPNAASYPPFLSRKVSTTVSPRPGAGSGGYTPPNPPTSLSQPPNLMSLGTGHFNCAFPVRPEELSPRSFENSAEGSEPEDDCDGDESRSCSPPPTPAHDAGSTGSPHTIVIKGDFIVEELSDFGEDDMEGRDDVIRPDAIEYADSERSMSQPRRPKDDSHLERHVINDLRDLNFRSPGREASSDASDLSDAEHQEMLRKMRAEDRRKRQSMTSVTKRTMSERSDSDHEDSRRSFGFEEVGSSARRLRRKVGDRRSLIFQDPQPKIDELDELPEELQDTEMLAKELPFYAYTSMEVDSPRSEYCWERNQ
ncbi:hypothetical protein SLS53_008550 [Cytospora paraplurivora]|uniref:Uncharacterized protein n=1 Tax=Cytospora paraplurivora TaxID=2898453 RepID=A0AAN9YCN0_9PEZI